MKNAILFLFCLFIISPSLAAPCRAEAELGGEWCLELFSRYDEWEDPTTSVTISQNGQAVIVQGFGPKMTGLALGSAIFFGYRDWDEFYLFSARALGERLVGRYFIGVIAGGIEPVIFVDVGVHLMTRGACPED